MRKRNAEECEEDGKRGLLDNDGRGLMCCALACGNRCPLISGAWKTMRMMENKARMYRL